VRDIWPALPIVLAHNYEDWQPGWGVDNVVAALKQNDRICTIVLSGVPTLQMEEILAAMHKPFPVLTELSLKSFNETASVDPLFLGGSATCLRILHLDYITFPGLPKLLPSAAHLTDLLLNLSPSGYISPEAIVSCFFALTRLETLEFEFSGSLPIMEHRPPPPPTRTLLPALTELRFYGVSGYLEDLVVRIDAPLLDDLKISFFHQFIPDTAQLAQFINRLPKLKAHNDAHVDFQDDGIYLKLGPALEKGLGISYEVKDSQVLSVAQICTSSLFQAFSASVECLYICNAHSYTNSQVVVLGESNHWLELLQPFTSVKSLYLSGAIVPYIARAFRELFGEGVAGVLPTLKTLFLEKFDPYPWTPDELYGPTLSGREFSGRPVAVSRWGGEWDD
jgi:hypothetical protein